MFSENTMRPSTIFLVTAVLFSIGLLAGCESKQQSDTEAVMQRANAYWEAARIYDLVTMYDMELQALEGSFIAADAARILNSSTRVGGYTLSNPKVDGDTATIDLDLKMTIAQESGGWDLPRRQDTWTKKNGIWYHGKPRPAEEKQNNPTLPQPSAAESQPTPSQTEVTGGQPAPEAVPPAAGSQGPAN